MSANRSSMPIIRHKLTEPTTNKQNMKEMDKENKKLDASFNQVACQRHQRHREVESYLNRKYNLNKQPEYNELKEMAKKTDKSIQSIYEWFEIKRAMSLRNSPKIQS